MRNEDLITRATAHAVLRYAIILSGWVFLGSYLIYEYQEYGADLITHLLSSDSVSAFFFHRVMILAPVMSTFVGHVMKRLDIAERNAQKAEEELLSVYNAISGHLTVISPDFRILNYNKNMEKHFGGDLKGRLCYEAFRARDGVCPDCAVKQTLKTKKPAYSYQPATSLSKPMAIYTYPIFDEKGGVSAVVEHGVEVAEKTELEEKFNRQKVFLNTVFEATPDLMYIKDKEGRFLMVNNAFEEFMGVSREEAMGMTLEDILPGELAREARVSDLRVIAGETYHQANKAFKGGEEFIYDTFKMPLRDNDGTVFGLVGLSRDITDLERAIEALRESEELYRTFTTNFQGIAFRGDMNFIPLFFHGAVEKITGYREQDFLSAKPKWNEIIHQDDKDRLSASFQMIRTTPEFYDEREYRIVRKDGEVRWVREYIQNVCDDSGKPVYVQGSIYDVHERKLAEEKNKRIIEAIPDMLFVIDKEGTFVNFHSPRSEDLYVPPGKIIGSNIRELIPEIAEDAIRHVKRTLETGEKAIFGYSLQMPEGVQHYEASIGPYSSNEAIAIIRNVTERKLTEESIQLLLRAVESLTVGVTISDANGKIVYTNPAEAEMHGYEVEELMGKDVNCLAPSELWQDVELKVRGRAFNRESMNLRKDGSVFPVHLTSVGVAGEDGAPFTIITVCEDITERKLAEEALRGSEERYRALIENIAVGIAVISPRMEILSVNNKMQEWFPDIDASKRPICYRSFNQPPRDSECSYCPITKTLKDGEVHVAITDTPAGDEIKHYKIVASPLRNENGEIVAVIEMCEDITERQRAEEELKAAKDIAEEERAKTEAIIACIGDGISIHDCEFRILYQNEAQVGMIGQHVGEYCYQAYEGKDHVCEGCPLAKAFEDGGIHHSERTVTVGDEFLHVSITSSPLRDAEGNIIAGIEVVKDITERKRAEEELAYNQLFLKSIIENEPECVKLVDAEGTLIDMNASGLKMIDADSLEQVRGKNVYDLVAPEHREAFKAHVERVCQGEKSMLEFRAIGLKGRSIWLETHAVPFYDAREKRTLLLAVTRDTTERKEADTILREREKQLAESQRIAHIGSWRHNLTTNEAVWSDELFRVMGLDPEKDPADFDMFFSMIHPEDQPMLRKAIEETLETGKQFSVDYRFRMRDGRTRILHAQAELITDETGTQHILSGTGQDITERKQAEEEIREINARLQTLVDSIPGIVFFKDAEGRHLVANKTCVEMIGLEEEEIIGKTADDFFPANIAEYCNRSDEEVIRAGRTIRGEEEAGGKVLETIKSPLFDNRGNYKGLVGLSFDVTERKRAEEALRKSEERYHGLFDSARDAIMIADVESGIIVNANRQAEKLLGRPASEIIGMHQSEIHPEEDKDLYISSFRKAVKNERAAFPAPGGDMYVVDKEGRKIPVEISANVIELEGKRLIQGIFRDITERRAAERAAREGRQYLENVLNSIQDGLAIIALDHTIVMANPTIEKWYAHRAPVVGRKCYEVFRGQMEVCNPCPCSEARDKGESCFDVVSHYGPEGRGGTLELYGFPLSDPSTGEVTGMVHYYRDITDRVALQAEAFRAAQLASVGELAAGVAHEINNPINGIINYAQMLIDRLPKGSEENSISHRIIKEGDRISDIVSALLTFTREDGLMEEPLHIGELVSEALSLTIAQLAKDGIDVRTNISADMPRVSAKRQHLEQVFLNLITNARHALNVKYPESHPGKVLEISGESMDAEEIPHVRISFKDLGTGIPADIIDRVTEPFFTTKQKGSGTGLGLSISSSIIKNSGGTLSIESVEGEYTKVTIELPINGAR